MKLFSSRAAHVFFTTPATRAQVSWADLERLLREKADACGLAELESSCVKVAALERVELGLARAVGMEEVLYRVPCVCFSGVAL